MQHVLLLHGAIGAKSQFKPLADALQSYYEVHTLSFSGHGGEAFSPTAFSISSFAREVLDYMDASGIGKTSVFGYSMGGYVAMYIAKHHPERIERIATLATKFLWDEGIAEKEMGMLDAEKIEAKLPSFADALRERHHPNDWKEILARTKDMLYQLGQDNILKAQDYSTIEVPSLILLGDRDKMVSLDETVDVYKKLPNAKMGVLPGTPHPIEQVPLQPLVNLLTDFIG